MDLKIPSFLSASEVVSFCPGSCRKSHRSLTSEVNFVRTRPRISDKFSRFLKNIHRFITTVILIRIKSYGIWLKESVTIHTYIHTIMPFSVPQASYVTMRWWRWLSNHMGRVYCLVLRFFQLFCNSVLERWMDCRSASYVAFSVALPAQAGLQRNWPSFPQSPLTV